MQSVVFSSPLPSTPSPPFCLSSGFQTRPSVYIKFTPPQVIKLSPEAAVDGCYFMKQGDEYLVSLTSCIDGVDYERSLSVVCLDPAFSLHLPTDDNSMPVNTAVELGVQAFLKNNAPPSSDLSQTVTGPDGETKHLIDGRARSRQKRIDLFRSQEPAFRECLNIIINAACFIAFRPDDICDSWEGEPPSDLISASVAPDDTRKKRDRKREALRKMEAGDFTRIKICGKKLFAGSATDDAVEGSGVSPRAHWRRGHWRRQRHGTGLTLVVLRWIRPTVVMKDNGPLVEGRIYEAPPDIATNASS